MAGELGAIVGEQVFGRAALANKPIQLWTPFSPRRR